MRVMLVMLLVACGGEDNGARIDAGPCIDLTHDEDGDGIGDDCDICPAAPDPLQRDTTEEATMLVFPDGVGDACDPRPALSGDVLGAFHPFADPATVVAWNGTGWTIDSDTARANSAARWTHRTRESGDGVFVQARLAKLDWAAGGRFEVVVDGDGVDIGFVCAIVKDTDGDGADELEAREVGIGAPVTKSTTMPIEGAIIVTAWRQIDVQRRGEFRCRVKFDGGMADLEFATSDDLAVGIYGIAQASSTTEVSSIVVYTSPTLPMDDL